jgi:PmbA protein
MSLRNRQELLDLADTVLDAVGHDGAEVRIVEHQSALTRFARNRIHQNVAETSLHMRLRVIRDDRVGIARIRGDMEDGPQRLVQAAEAARRLAPATDVIPLPRPDGGPDAPVAYSVATAEADPEWRADQVNQIVVAAAAAGVQAYGALETTLTHTAVVSGRGMRRHAEATTASLVSVVRGADGAGYADRHAADIGGLDAAGMTEEVIETCGRNQAATPIEPGVYPVVLSPYAVAELVGHLAGLGFSALAHQEHRSFMRPGERLMSETVSITDDAAHPEAMPFPFDGEGVSTRGVSFIEHGVCRSFVQDTATALREGVLSTGHALPMPNTYGPWARHLVVAPGEDDLDSLIAGCDGGLFVTRLWYVRDVHPLRTIITGMTREGTFRIEKGKLGHPVKDLRFTQSIVEALDHVRGVGRSRSLQVEESERAVLAPALLLGRFTFSS